MTSSLKDLTRPWEIWLVHHTHVDIGYTAPQDVILRKHAEFVAQALDYCAATDALPSGERFCWTCEVSWTVKAFLARYPEVFIDLVLTDQVVNVREEKTDIAIRTGPLRDSGLVSRELGASRFVVVAAPAYLARHGAPAAGIASTMSASAPATAPASAAMPNSTG